jgi:hypothetical protein
VVFNRTDNLLVNFLIILAEFDILDLSLEFVVSIDTLLESARFILKLSHDGVFLMLEFE